jgi:hypothetical protein
MTVFKHVMGGPGAAGDVWTSGLHTTGVLSVSAAQTAWVAFVADVAGASGLGPLWPTEVSVATANTYTLDPTSGKATALVLGSVTAAGTAVGDASPPRDAVVIGLRTNKPGPAGRGRMYLPLVNRGALTATGLITSTAQTTIAGAFAAALSDLATAGLLPVVWRPGSPSGDAIIGVTVSAVPGNQRRRSNKISPQYVSATIA